jgi:hypothetical protein
MHDSTALAIGRIVRKLLFANGCTLIFLEIDHSIRPCIAIAMNDII